MTPELALEYIKRRTTELCYGDCYSIRLRHFVLQPFERRSVDAHNQFFVLLEPYCDLRIKSSSSVFDLSEDLANELQYEHRGDILLTNLSAQIIHTRMIQVIPQNAAPCP